MAQITNPIVSPAHAGPNLPPERIRLLEPHEWVPRGDAEYVRAVINGWQAAFGSTVTPTDICGLALELVLTYARRRFLPRMCTFRIEQLDPLYEPVMDVIHQLFPEVLFGSGFVPRIALAQNTLHTTMAERWGAWRWEVYDLAQPGVRRIWAMAPSRQTVLVRQMWWVRGIAYGGVGAVIKAGRDAAADKRQGKRVRAPMPELRQDLNDQLFVANALLVLKDPVLRESILFTDADGRVSLSRDGLHDKARSAAGSSVFLQQIGTAHTAPDEKRDEGFDSGLGTSPRRASAVRRVDVEDIDALECSATLDAVQAVEAISRKERILEVRRALEDVAAACEPGSLDRRIAGEIELFGDEDGVLSKYAALWSIPVSTLGAARARVVARLTVRLRRFAAA